MDTLIYLLKASAVLCLFFSIYHVFLKRDTFHLFKRFYLIVGLFISAILPGLHYTKIVVREPASNVLNNTLVNTQITSAEHSNLASSIKDILTFSWDEAILKFYFLVSLILLARLIFKYTKFLFQIYKTPYKKIDQHKVHIVEATINPFSFFNHIVMGQKDYASEKFDMIFTHEKVHIIQWHSIDILLSNLFCVLFWYNPFMWFYKQSIVQNLEYIADKQSIETLKDKLKYQYVLLSNSFSASDLQTIKTTFFQSSIKQRIMMLNKSNTSKIYALKSIIVLPILVAFFMSFQAKVVAQEKHKSKTNTRVANVKYSDDTKTITTDNNDNVTDSSYKSERIAVKITKYADREFLDWTKRYLKNKYDIDVNYSKIKFNKDKKLTSIKVDVDCNDGFKGSSSQKGSQPIYDFYFYRDYSENAKSAFGLNDELPFSSSEKNDDSVKYSISVVLSPGDPYKTEMKSDVEAELKSDLEKFKDIEKFRINGENFDIKNMVSKAIIMKSYRFIDDKALEIDGQIIDHKDYESYLKSKLKSSGSNTLKNIQVLMITKKAKPVFLDIEKLSIEEE
ncbi:M56 family metallopeptidase [Mesohalobacter halotolerans]|uniref:M56 family metallopeptidase n=1 Tax=Mesohalobacter halotolerans TaxID=1883405 RepID=A0A4U5TPM3_9FLAO|nr:M56 family metallopeptidase [Mesohalobacter halotolerans]TKS56069.1 M56 family metallopeptidase [Mesohalobacter halotolerans]